MTTSEADLPAGSDPLALDAVETGDVLKRLQDSALGLLAGLDAPPRLLRIKAGRVELELEWPAAGSVIAPVAPAPAVAGPAAPADDKQYLTAHMVGVFYRAPQPGADPFVEVGDVINRGQQVGIIEAMKLMLPVEADVIGRVTDVLVADGQAVEYGDKLFALEPADG